MSEGRVEKIKTNNVLADVKPENAFYFCLEEGNYTGRNAQNLIQFYETLKTVEPKSIEFHTQRGDFEKWIRFLGDNILALQLARIRKKPLEGEKLREKICDTIGKRINKLRGSESPPSA
ncbi:MAG: hypothetical protein FJZ49_05385 [Candidatus Verstraetearchaeota archaeon]|nr:hypothetical protein [Candidatus Verstraetearchaeota archaeon]